MKPNEIQCEVCIDSVAGAVAAERGGAHRVELCANLAEGGTTPSAGMMRAVLDAVQLPVMVMLRPRGGDFVFDPHELDVMRRDLENIVESDRTGLVIGALTPDGRVDMTICRKICDLAGERSVTFHRAFDHVCDPFASLDQLVELGIDRILTSGQMPTAEQGIPTLRELVQYARDRIAIMPGAGIRASNARRILTRTGARQIHFSASDVTHSEVTFRCAEVPMGSERVPDDYVRRITSERRVREICHAACSSGE